MQESENNPQAFCLGILEKLMKDCPGGSYLVMNINQRVPGGRPLTSIGYKYNSRKVLGIIATEGTESTESGYPYLSCFPDICSNVSVCPFVCPHLTGSCFNDCNTIDNHIRMRQYDLALEKYWITQSDYFRYATIVVLGMGVKYENLLLCHSIS